MGRGLLGMELWTLCLAAGTLGKKAVAACRMGAGPLERDTKGLEVARRPLEITGGIRPVRLIKK